MGKASRAKRETPIEALERLYAQLPKVACKGLCENTCNVIPCTPVEKARLEKRLGRAFTPTGSLPGRIRCAALGPDGRCTTYTIRPMICRLFGIVDHPYMRCKHGCIPERWVGGLELKKLMDEVKAAGGGRFDYPEVPGWPRLSDSEAEAAARMFKP